MMVLYTCRWGEWEERERGSLFRRVDSQTGPPVGCLLSCLLSPLPGSPGRDKDNTLHTHTNKHIPQHHFQSSHNGEPVPQYLVLGLTLPILLMVYCKVRVLRVVLKYHFHKEQCFIRLQYELSRVGVAVSRPMAALENVT